jgi:hypothetical protein
LSCWLLSSLTGFLLFNFEPARVFMGDSGSLSRLRLPPQVCYAYKTETIVGLALPSWL